MIPAPVTMVPTMTRFPQWYPGQYELLSTVMDWLGTDDKFLGVEAPTGSGKSLVSMMAANLSGKRTVNRDFSETFADIRGQNAYDCLEFGGRVDQAPCHDGGYSCPKRERGCTYYDDLTTALESSIVVTNYAFALAQNNYGRGLDAERPIDLLICDEAHLAFPAVEGFLAFTVTHRDADRYKYRVPTTVFDAATYKAQFPLIRDWASDMLASVKSRIADLDVAHAIAEGDDAERARLTSLTRREKSLGVRLTSLIDTKEPWAWESVYGGIRFTPVWPAQYQRLLFGKAKRVLLLSAVLSRKTMDLVGVPKSAPLVVAPSYFPPEKTPIWRIPTVRVNSRTTPIEMANWVERIDQIIDARLDRKGIIFTVSYSRQKFLVENSRHQHRMITHASGDVVKAVEEFRKYPPGHVLVSPSVTSGWDFPDDDCRYVVVGKIPYPDTRVNVIQARTKSDKSWTSFQAMETVVQEAGRGTRSTTDWCEVLIVDDNWGWFYERYWEFAPSSFANRIQGVSRVVPTPLQLEVATES